MLTFSLASPLCRHSFSPASGTMSSAVLSHRTIGWLTWGNGNDFDDALLLMDERSASLLR